MAFTAFEQYVAHGLGSTERERVRSVVPEEQNSDYESGIADLGGERWRIRTARVTPRKPGAFVALWTRDDTGTTVPFPGEDASSGVLVFVSEGERRGVFRFTAEHLRGLGITTTSRHPGKRGFRVYPSWSAGLTPRAAATQEAQASAFRELPAN